MNFFTATLGSYRKVQTRFTLIIFNGESNSGGMSLNSDAPSNELGLQSSVQILNNYNLQFETLNIGINNLIDHAYLSNGVSHGWELELAQRASINPYFYENTKLIKTGQGGSTIAQWLNLTGPYFGKFENRINHAKEILNFSFANPVIFFSLGINDSIAGTNINTWKAGVTQHFENIRATIGLGNIPIIMTEFQGMGNLGIQHDAFTVAIQELANILPNVYSINTAGAAIQDVNHWNYTGMKFVADKLLDKFENLI